MAGYRILCPRKTQFLSIKIVSQKKNCSWDIHLNKFVQFKEEERWHLTLDWTKLF